MKEETKNNNITKM